MDMQKLKTRLAKAKTNLVLEHPFVGAIALGMPHEFSDAVPTAATNGKRVLYNPEFVAGLSDAELKFLVAHECLHPMLEHNFRRGSRDPKGWNIAADIVINHHLIAEEIGTFIEGGQHNPALFAAGEGVTENIYGLLPADQKDGSGSGSGIGGAGQDLEDGDGTAADQQQQAAEWKIKVAQSAQAARMMGKLSANMERLVDEVLTPKVVWQDVLQRFLVRAQTDERSFARPNRRFLPQGLFMPSRSGEALGEIVFAVDMSGSISTEEANQFGAEGRKVHEDLHPEKLHFIFFSHEVTGHDTLGPDEPFVFNARGGGGTAFSPVFRRIEEAGIDPVCCVFLTDLCCSDFGPEPGYPVLWVSTHSDSAPFGDVVMMK